MSTIQTALGGLHSIYVRMRNPEPPDLFGTAQFRFSLGILLLPTASYYELCHDVWHLEL